MNADPFFDDLDEAPELPSTHQTGYDEDGNPCLVSMPVDIADEGDAEDSRPATNYEGLLALLTMGATSAEQIGKRAALLAYVMNPPHKRGTLVDLGRVLGVSKQRAQVVLTQFKRDLPTIARESGFEC